jgi:adenylate kinase family enzyme
MDRLVVVIITGPPGTGKSTLGKRLAKELGLPFISKDGIKESLFDTLGWQDREWSKKLGHASVELLFHFLEAQLEAGKSLIVETAFIPKFHTARFLELRNRYGFEPIQILCRADDEVSFRRFRERTESGKRHPGHVDHLATYDQFKAASWEGKYGVLDIGGSIFEIDTTDFNRIDYQGLLEAIESTRGGMKP